MPSCLLVVLSPQHRAQAASGGLQPIPTLLEASPLQPSGGSCTRGQTLLHRAGPSLLAVSSELPAVWCLPPCRCLPVLPGLCLAFSPAGPTSPLVSPSPGWQLPPASSPHAASVPLDRPPIPHSQQQFLSLNSVHSNDQCGVCSPGGTLADIGT